MSLLVTLLAIVIVFVIMFQMVSWGSPPLTPQKILYLILALAAILIVLNMVGLLGRPLFVRVP